MTTKDVSDHVNRTKRARAVWLARVPAGRAPVSEADEGLQRDVARHLARRVGIEIVAEFLYTVAPDEALTSRAWTEVLDFVRDRRAATLFVLRPQDLATGFSDYAARIEDLEVGGIRLVLPDSLGLPQPATSSNRQSRAA